VNSVARPGSLPVISSLQTATRRGRTDICFSDTHTGPLATNPLSEGVIHGARGFLLHLGIYSAPTKTFEAALRSLGTSGMGPAVESGTI
jgi:hypothetical protein